MYSKSHLGVLVLEPVGHLPPCLRVYGAVLHATNTVPQMVQGTMVQRTMYSAAHLCVRVLLERVDRLPSCVKLWRCEHRTANGTANSVLTSVSLYLSALAISRPVSESMAPCLTCRRSSSRSSVRVCIVPTWCAVANAQWRKCAMEVAVLESLELQPQ
jgi:hypothetical protein